MKHSKKEFDDAIKLTKHAFRIIGIELGHSNYLAPLFYFNLLWLYTDVIGEFYWLVEGINLGKSLDELSMLAPCATMCIFGTIKIVPLFINKEILLTALDTIKYIHPDFHDAKDKVDLNNVIVEKRIYDESNKLLKSVVLFLCTISVMVTIAFCTEPVMIMAYEYHTTGVMELKLPFLIKYFFDEFANNTIYVFVYFHQIWSTICVCTYVFASDTLFYLFCTYLSMHFGILAHRFTNVVSSVEETKENLREYIERHQTLIATVNQLQILYSKSTLFNMLSSSIVLCLTGFNIAVVQKSSVTMAFAPLLMMSLLQIYLMCYFGDLLMASSIQLSNAAYNSRWYKAEPDIKKSIMIIIRRSQKPCKLTAAGFVDLNLRAFTTILSRSWTYFTLLKTMYS